MILEEERKRGMLSDVASQAMAEYAVEQFVSAHRATAFVRFIKITTSRPGQVSSEVHAKMAACLSHPTPRKNWYPWPLVA